MTISPVSNVASLYGPQGAQDQTPASKTKAPSQQPADTVKLSPAAKAHLKGADADGDGDRR
jgi:hypothetical protein